MISNNIKVAALYLHKHRGLTYREIGERLDVDHTSVYKWVTKEADKIKAQNLEDLGLFVVRLYKGTIQYRDEPPES